MDGQAAAAAINFAANFGLADDAVHGDRESEADAAVVGMGVEIGLKTIRKGEVHAAVAGVNGPTPGHFRSGGDASFDAAVAGLQVENVEAAVNADVAVARGGVETAVEVAGFDVAVAGAQADVASGAAHGDVAVAGVNIHVPAEGVHLDVAVTGGDVEIAFARHVHFNLQAAMDIAAENAPVIRDANININAVAVLADIAFDLAVGDVKTRGLDMNADFFLVPGINGNVAVVGLHAHLGASGNHIGLVPFIGAGGGRAPSQGRRSQPGS